MFFEDGTNVSTWHVSSFSLQSRTDALVPRSSISAASRDGARVLVRRSANNLCQWFVPSSLFLVFLTETDLRPSFIIRCYRCEFRPRVSFGSSLFADAFVSLLPSDPLQSWTRKDWMPHRCLVDLQALVHCSGGYWFHEDLSSEFSSNQARLLVNQD